MNNKKYWVWLGMVFGGGTYRLWQFMSVFETVREVCMELLSVSEAAGLTSKDIQNIKAYNLKDAELLIEECTKRGISIVTYEDSDYPNHLRYIADPPPVLFCKGNTACLSGTKTITSVGTRKAGNYSLSVCNRICTELAQKGYIIVSGFAVGVDIASHLAAAEAGYPTICVLGCGVDVDYPKENVQFRERILQSGGVFVSEYPPGTKPGRGNFPRRNRILSAIGKAAMVFEASDTSGSLITARLAAEQGHEVFVLPPSDIFSHSYSGNISLMKEGAVPITGTEVIDDFFQNNASVAAEVKNDAYAFVAAELLSGEGTSARYDLSAVDSFSKGNMQDSVTEYDEENDICEDEDVSENAAEEPVKADRSFEHLEGIKRDIAEIIRDKGRLHADIICNELGVDSADIMVELTELEILGVIKACPGRIYELL